MGDIILDMRQGIDKDAARWLAVNQQEKISKMGSIPEMFGLTYQRMMGDLDQTSHLARWFNSDVAARVVEYESGINGLLPELDTIQVGRMAALDMDHVMPFWMANLRGIDMMYGEKEVWEEGGGMVTIPVVTEWYERNKDRYMRIPIERVAGLFPSFLTNGLYPVDLKENKIVARKVGEAFVCADQDGELLKRLSRNTVVGQGLYDLDDLVSGKGRLVEIHKRLFGCLPSRRVTQMLESLKGIIITKGGFWNDVFSDKFGEWYLYLNDDFWGDNWKEVDESYFARLNCLAARMEAKAKYRLIGMMPDSYVVGMYAARETYKYLDGGNRAKDLKKTSRSIDGTEVIDWWRHVHYSYEYLASTPNSSGMHHLEIVDASRGWNDITFQQDYMEELDRSWRDLAPKLIPLRWRREKMYE